MNTFSFEIWYVTFSLLAVLSSAVNLYQPYTEDLFPRRSCCPQKVEGRIYFNAIQNFLDPYLPITINVPDMVAFFGEYMGSVYQYFFSGGQNPSTTPRIWEELLREVDVIISEF
ncbi:uncharacterized protein LOC106671041 [Cimex lectularius]|uniref:Uncharacterized protein n=1 Tax=Cimex lectularius TaxID=79782 RepID=A0A8I6S6W7_CIMLE|nr:uncharacterized protein LOC106671041 [Cimex lectularius]